MRFPRNDRRFRATNHSDTTSNERKMPNDSALNDRPWEDTLILAFRDMQWLHQIRNSARSSEGSSIVPPGLMIKLDGNAESTSGDVLAQNEARFFLLEFKSDSALFYRENGKRIHDLLVKIAKDHPDGEDLIELSTRGHLMVFPRSVDGSDHVNKPFAPVHHLSLRCLPYYEAILKTVSQELRKKPPMLDSRFYKSDEGMDLDEMSRYLSALAQEGKESRGGDTPFKAVIANSKGLFWPVGSLSDFMSFIQAIGQQNSYTAPQETAKERAAVPLRRRDDSLDDGYSR